MKRFVQIALCFLLILAFSCTPAKTGTGDESTPAATAAATATPAPTPELTPEPLGLAPIDLLGKGYNPFFDIAFPAGYTVFGAQFSTADAHTGAKDTYLLNLVAAGNPTDIAKTCAGMLGVTDEAQLSTYLASLEKDGFVVIEGAYAGSPASVEMKKTSAGTDFDQCTEVDGCRVEFAVEIDADSAKNCSALVLANYSTAALGNLAAQFGDDTIHKDQLSIFVNTEKPDKTTVYIFHTVQDAAALLSSIKETLQTSWFDEAYSSLVLQYGRQNLAYTFNLDNNVVQVKLSPNDNSTPAGEFRLSDVSLTKFGFRYDQEQRFCILEDKQNGYMIVVSKPEWERAEDDWNLMFYKDEIYMFYREDSNLFTVTVTYNGVQAGCDYNCAKNTFGGEGWPSEETMQQNFSAVLGGAQEDVRAGVFAVFTDLVQQRFGMTWQELYALPIW